MYLGRTGSIVGTKWCNNTKFGARMNKILLAEDDNDMRRFLAKALANAGYDVISYDNGASAYERLREEPFTLLLTDIVMPEMDGIELARRATELDPDLKVMFITGLLRWPSIRNPMPPRKPRFCPNRFICVIWSMKWKKCWLPECKNSAILIYSCG